MAIHYNNTPVKGVTFNGEEVKMIILNGATTYCKEYILRVVVDDGVKNYSILRQESQEPTVECYTFLEDNDPIYYGDILKVNATAKDGYEMKDYDTTIEVTGNVNISLTTNIKETIVVDPPIITVTSVEDTSLKVFNITVTFENPNNYKMDCFYTYEVSSQGINLSGIVDNINGGESKSISAQLPSNQGIIRGTVTAYLEYNYELPILKSETTTKDFSVKGAGGTLG